MPAVVQGVNPVPPPVGAAGVPPPPRLHAMNAPPRAGGQPNNPLGSARNILIIGGCSLLLVVLAIVGVVMSGGRETKTSPSKKVSALKSATAGPLAQSLMNSAIRVEARTDLFSSPYDPEDTAEEDRRPDVFNLGDDPTDPMSAREAWVKITQQAPPNFRQTHKKFDEATQMAYIGNVLERDLANGLSVEEIIVNWPKHIKGWKSDARIDDPAGWTYASEYSDSLRAEYLRTYEGRTYGTLVTAKSLITPKALDHRPFTWPPVWSWLLWTVAVYLLIYIWLLIAFKRKWNTGVSYEVWALVPAVVSGYLFCGAIAAPWMQQDSNHRTFIVLGLSVLYTFVPFSYCRQGYEDLKKRVGS